MSGRWRRRAEAMRRLGWQERLLAGEAAATLALARALVLTVPVHRVAGLLVSDSGKASAANVAGIARIVPATARMMPFRALCLEQALAAAMMLRWRGIAATLHLGTARGEGAGFAAHAWLSVAGAVVVGGPVDGYVELTRF